MARVVAIGEAMLELTGGPVDWRLGVAGDVFNTAVHLTRAGHQTGFLTAVGIDGFSDRLIERLVGEGIDPSLVLRNPARRPGLYAVSLDTAGERSFTYWRDSSAARTMLDLPTTGEALARAAHCDLLYFSLITLAILPAERVPLVLDLARAVRANGGQVAFDSNYRPALWTGIEAAQSARDAAIAVATIGLPTLDDEVMLEGAIDARTVADHWSGLGCARTLVKIGADGCRLPSGEIVRPDAIATPVDTTGAGDAFNGGFLAAMLHGATLRDAARAGNDLAGRTIMHPGAIAAASR